MQPLASIEALVRRPSDSQEQLLFDASLNDSGISPDLSFFPFSPSPGGGGGGGGGGDGFPLSQADAPILICSLPDAPSSVTPAVPSATAAAISHLGLGLPEAGVEGRSPVTTGAHQPSPKSPSAAHVGEVHPGGRPVLRSSSNRWKKKCRASRWQLRRRQIKSPVTHCESPAKGHRGLAGEGGLGNDPFKKYLYQPREASESTTRNPSASVKIVPGPINPSGLTQNLPLEGGASKLADREDCMQSKCRYQPQEVHERATVSPKATASVAPGPGKSPVLIQNPPLEVREPPLEVREAGSTSVYCGENPSPPSVPSPVASSVMEPRLSLLDTMKMLSKEPDMKYANTDLLEIMEMKGIEILPPQWWRSGGYDDLKHSISE